MNVGHNHAMVNVKKPSNAGICVEEEPAKRGVLVKIDSGKETVFRE